MQTSWMIYTAAKAVAVMAFNSFTGIRCIWMTLWRNCLGWNA
jgi:hypothetical protein